MTIRQSFVPTKAIQNPSNLATIERLLEERRINIGVGYKRDLKKWLIVFFKDNKAPEPEKREKAKPKGKGKGKGKGRAKK